MTDDLDLDALLSDLPPMGPLPEGVLRRGLTRNPATADGLPVGSTLDGLCQAHPDVVMTAGSLGPEWAVPHGLAGGLDGTTPSSTVNRIGAGQNCLAR